MACFLVPAAEAVVTTAATKILQKKEAKADQQSADIAEAEGKLPFSRKLKWLSHMLIGGSVLLCFEHIWHGEVVPFFPFLTAASDSEAFADMLHEMGTVGVTMSAIVTLAWIGMLAASHRFEQQTEPAPQAAAPVSR